MATHASILAWEIPWTEETGRLQSMGCQRVRHNLATEQPATKSSPECYTGQQSPLMVSCRRAKREAEATATWTQDPHPLQPLPLWLLAPLPATTQGGRARFDWQTPDPHQDRGEPNGYKDGAQEIRSRKSSRQHLQSHPGPRPPLLSRSPWVASLSFSCSHYRNN